VDLGSELDAYAERGSRGAQDRLANSAVRDDLRARVRRVKTRARLALAAGTVGAIAFGAAVVATPHDAQLSPSPSPSGQAEVSERRPLPHLDTTGYLVTPGGAFVTQEAVTCQQIPDVPVSMDALPYPGSMPPLPTWIEAARIYGLSDGLPPSYPIPLYSRDGAMFYQLAVSEIMREYPASVRVTLALIAEDGSWWGFTARYGVVDDMPLDDPGLFLTLTPDPFCQGGPRAVDRSPIPAGTYDARVMVTRPAGETVVSEFGDVRIVTGLPSWPFIPVTH
jgi:hypothetical protein